MGGPGIYPSDYNPTFSPVESSQLLHLQGRRVHKTSEYFSFFLSLSLPLPQCGCILILHTSCNCHVRDGVVLVETVVCRLNLERYSMFWPDSVSFLPLLSCMPTWT